MRLFLIFLFTCAFFLSSLLQPRMGYASECRFPQIPFSVSPTTSGDENTEFEFQITIPEELAEDYRGLQPTVWFNASNEGGSSVNTVGKFEPVNGDADQDQVLVFSSGISRVSQGDYEMVIDVSASQIGEECAAEPVTISFTRISDAPILREEGEACDVDEIKGENMNCVSGTECLEVDFTGTFQCMSTVKRIEVSLPPTEPPVAPPCVTGDVDETGIEEAECETAIGVINVSDFSSIVRAVFRWVMAIAGIVLLYQLVRAGYEILASRGDQEKIADARQRITAAVIGLLFILFSIAILEIIGTDVLGIFGPNSPLTAPQ